MGDGTNRITERQWLGAIDGGAKKWQMYWVKDWEYPNGVATFKEKWGPTAWRTDVNLSGWYGIANDDRIRTSPTTVQFKLRYEETANGQTYYWCSPIYEHYLHTRSSATVGTGACTQ